MEAIVERRGSRIYPFAAASAIVASLIALVLMFKILGALNDGCLATRTSSDAVSGTIQSEFKELRQEMTRQNDRVVASLEAGARVYGDGLHTMASAIDAAREMAAAKADGVTGAITSNGQAERTALEGVAHQIQGIEEETAKVRALLEEQKRAQAALAVSPPPAPPAPAPSPTPLPSAAELAESRPKPPEGSVVAQSRPKLLEPRPGTRTVCVIRPEQMSEKFAAADVRSGRVRVGPNQGGVVARNFLSLFGTSWIDIAVGADGSFTPSPYARKVSFYSLDEAFAVEKDQ